MELRIRIGSAVMRVPKPCGRCTMVTRAQPGIDADQKIFTSLAHEHGATFGVLCDVGSAGIIHLDDEVELLGRGPRRYWDSATLRQQPWVQGLRIESLTTFGRSAYDLSRARSAARMPAPPRIVAAVITAQFHVCEAEDLRGAGVHLPGPGIAAARHGIELEGPPFLRTRRPSERNCGSRCCRAPPRRRRTAQLATFVSSLIALDAAERLGLEPFACAGHSLGEYSALVATGSLSYEDGLRLVAERGAAMQDAADSRAGTMMAVLGLDDDDVESACVRAEGDAWVANYNAPGQVVIAGEKEALERASEIAKSLGAKRVLSFPVGGAFHPPFMAPARDRLRKAISEINFREPEPIVVANVDARSHGAPSDWPGLLSAQLCSPVRWRQTLTTLSELGCRTFIELGPGG